MASRSLTIWFLFLTGIILVSLAIIPHYHQILVAKVVEVIINDHRKDDSRLPVKHTHEQEGSKVRNYDLVMMVISCSGILRSTSLLVPASIPDYDHMQPFSDCFAFIHQDSIPEFSLFRGTDDQKSPKLLINKDKQFRGPSAKLLSHHFDLIDLYCICSLFQICSSTNQSHSNQIVLCVLPFQNY